MNKKHQKKHKKKICLVTALCVLLNIFMMGAISEYGYAATDNDIIIDYFENHSPVFTKRVEPGTQINELGLPETMRGIVGLSDQEKGQEFVPAEPTADELGDFEYYSYGYVRPQEGNVYSIIYKDDDIQFRVYGSLNGGPNEWFSSDMEGNPEGRVVAVPVLWENSNYDAEVEGEYTFTASFDNYSYNDATMPMGVITVKHIDPLETYHDDEHMEIIGSVTEEQSVVDSEGLPDESDTAIDMPLISPDEEGQSTSPTALMSSQMISHGANDLRMNELITMHTPTKGNAEFTSTYTYNEIIPGTWIDYVNTIWMNRAMTEFSWVESQIETSWKWQGGASTGGEDASSASNSLPNRDGNTWMVYSAAQFKYALQKVADQEGDTIEIKRNLDFDGANTQWDPQLMNAQDLTIIGNGFTFYNIGIYSTERNNYDAVFITKFHNLTITDLNFEGVKIVAKDASVGLFRVASRSEGGIDAKVELTDVHISNSMFYNTKPDDPNLSSAGVTAPFGHLLDGGLNNAAAYITRCSVQDSYIYGIDHVGGFMLGAASSGSSLVSEVEYSFSANNLICGVGGHSSGFIPCSGEPVSIENSFAANEIYGSVAVSAFRGGIGGPTKNCFATGKLEGYSMLGGFTYAFEGVSSSIGTRTFENCYSTTLVGLRSPATEGESLKRQGGFAASMDDRNYGYSFKDCYAAGEVGNYDIDMNHPGSVGGFFANENTNAIVTNCYYDKQTTAMREWAAGDSKSVAGVTGLLTSTTDKSGVGLATKEASIYLGTENWIYKDNQYPQLRSIINSNPDNWGSEELYQTALSYSDISTATVLLNTWDSGYVWDEQGVRSEDIELYDKENEENIAGANTYDTVREVMSDFIITPEVSFTQMISGHSPMSINNQLQETAPAFTINNGAGDVSGVGMEWYQIETNNMGRNVGRPIRLASHIDIEAGADQSVLPGQLYDHRRDVSLTLLGQIMDNQVIGMNADQYWSTAVRGAYPDSNQFWSVPTSYLVSDYTVGDEAWINTDIRKVLKDEEGNFVQKDGLYVTGDTVILSGPGTGSNNTIAEQQWNGRMLLAADNPGDQKYVITYYWHLKDGRYRSDSKIIHVFADEEEPLENRKPVLQSRDITIWRKQELDLFTLILSAFDDDDGDLSEVVSIESDDNIDYLKTGVYQITFGVSNSLGNHATSVSNVTVEDLFPELTINRVVSFKEGMTEEQFMASAVILAKDREGPVTLSSNFKQVIQDYDFGEYVVRIYATDDYHQSVYKEVVLVPEIEGPQIYFREGNGHVIYDIGTEVTYEQLIKDIKVGSNDWRNVEITEFYLDTSGVVWNKVGDYPVIIGVEDSNGNRNTIQGTVTLIDSLQVKPPGSPQTNDPLTFWSSLWYLLISAFIISVIIWLKYKKKQNNIL